MSEAKTVLIVDDEPLARERLKSMILGLDDFELAGEAGEGVAALALVEKYQPDLVLLDISMPGMSGLEVARHIEKLEQPPAVIFCTAYSEYAVEAFDAAAVGYLLKPIRADQLRSSLERAGKLNRLQLNDLDEAGVNQKARKTHISTRSHRGVELLEIAKITHFVSEDKYVFAHHEGGETILEQTLKALEEELEGLFIRTHRNALVSIRHIEALERAGAESRLRLRDTDEKPLVSRRHLKDVKDLMASL